MEDSLEAFRAHIAANITVEMERRGITQQQLAQTTGISPQTMGRRLRGEYPFTTDEIGILSRLFKVSVEALVARTGPQEIAS
ncbi:helix-turn-helix transcriptional regulator [Nocardia sp. CNY236]|uniref:helix-turn-helix transcriptional regulator n=1 Tax=Nocardia sp. CNY236 TaxID=1169152 RepID=UPI00042843F9|nr:helix-turn-helix transcriptional regulator [Nocardia sp. CNY236]